MALIIITLLTLLLAFFVVGAAFRVMHWIPRLVVPLITSLLFAGSVYILLASAPSIYDARYRTYSKFYHELSVGMTRAEALALLDKHYPANGPRQRPKFTDDQENYLGFFMNPEGLGEPNCEGIFIEFQDDRIIRLRYSPD